MDEVLESFPKSIQVKDEYKSFLFQPERVSLNSRQSLQSGEFLVNPGKLNNENIEVSDLYPPFDFYYQFKCDLKTPILRVKSLELLRASIPNAVPSIPLDECFFFYYKIPANELSFPDPTEFIADNIRCIYLYPPGFTYGYNFGKNPGLPYVNGYNTNFQDYDSLVKQLNLACQNNDIRLNSTNPRFEAGDIEFDIDEDYQRIVMIGNNAYDGDDCDFFYSPVGWSDSNLPEVIAELKANFADAGDPDGLGPIEIDINTDGFTLNRRLGFTFSGVGVGEVLQTIQLIRPRCVPFSNLTNGAPTPATAPPRYTAENPANLVNTANIFLYADIAGGSTQDTNTDDRLLAVIPTSGGNLQVSFGESKMSCELTKTSDNIYSILFTMRTDTGQPYWLPTNAYVNLELKLTYR